MKSFSVIIAGGGPVGLSMALALARQGIKTLVLEKHSRTTEHPKARGVNMRSMELFRTWGNATELLTHAQPKEARRFIWVKSLQGEEVTRVAMDYDTLVAYGPLLSSFVSQDHVEESLYHSLQQYEEASILFSHELVDFTQNSSGVTLRVLNRITEEQETLHATYLVAADGANSRIRQQLDITMEGPTDIGRYCNVYCDIDLSQWTKHRPAIAFMFADPTLTGRFLASVDGANRWIVGMRFKPDQTKDDFSDEYCINEIRRVTNLPELRVNIRAKNFWTMGAQNAVAYRKDHVFLVGDAAHRLPPTGGFGMNTGIQDAHNLAWKIAFVLKYNIADTLLDSYFTERHIIAKQNIDWSLENSKRHSDIAQAIKDGDMITLENKLQEQNRNLNYAGLDLGFIYHSDAIISENDQTISASIYEYVPTTLPGSRAPHVNLQKNGVPISTLDLFEKEFVLLVGSDGQAWEKAVAALIKERQFPLLCYRVASDGDLQDVEGIWQLTYEIDNTGTVLVRPDGHVAWRSKTIVKDPLTSLKSVLNKILFLPNQLAED